jgi:ribosome-binding protein aMBF1 (putative translation factor)
MSLGLLSYSQLLEGTGMGHYCRICGRERPNEQFSGKGHKIHVCKRCKARPKSERQAIEDKDDIFAFLARPLARPERHSNNLTLMIRDLL